LTLRSGGGGGGRVEEAMMMRGPTCHGPRFQRLPASPRTRGFGARTPAGILFRPPLLPPSD
jgi:hypothetical protein